jgi:Lamin Tail Domain
MVLHPPPATRPQKIEPGGAGTEWFQIVEQGTRLATFCSVRRPFLPALLATALLAACGTETPPVTTASADAGPPPPDAAPVAQGDEARGAVAINEVQSSSPGGASDWIELRTTGTTAVDLTGYYLSDAPDRLDHFYRFPAGTTLAPGAYLVVLADNGKPGEGHHAPFKLSREDGVYLLDPDGQVIDSLLYLGVTDGRSLARHPDGAGRFFYAPATQGGANP